MKRILVLLSIAILAFAGGYYWRTRMDDQYRMVQQSIGNNPQEFRYYTKEGLNCVDTWEVAASFCSIYKVKGEQTKQ